MKFLIDECLSLKLADLAVERGYVESSHVVRLGKSGWTGSSSHSSSTATGRL